MVSFLKKLLGEEKREDERAVITDSELEEFVEIDVDAPKNQEILFYVKPLVISEYLDVKPALRLIREGKYILLINTKPLKTRDSVELKRVVEKLKQAVDSLGGDIIGFGKGEWLLVTPPGIKVDRGNEEKREEEKEEE